MRLCLANIRTCSEVEATLLYVLVLDGLPNYAFVRQLSDDVTTLNFHLTLAHFYCLVHLFLLDNQPTRADTDHVPLLHRGTETGHESTSELGVIVAITTLLSGSCDFTLFILIVHTMKTVNLDWSPAQAWVAPEVLRNRIKMHFGEQNAISPHEQPHFRLGGAPITVKATLTNQTLQLRNQPTSPPDLEPTAPFAPPFRVKRATRRFTALSEGFGTRQSSVATRPQCIMQTFRCAKRRAICPHEYRSAAFSAAALLPD
eukprot:6175387-Pleurochrysis_carterae.AAC.6